MSLGTSHSILDASDNYAERHIGPRGKDISTMLKALEIGSVGELMDQVTDIGA